MQIQSMDDVGARVRRSVVQGLARSANGEHRGLDAECLAFGVLQGVEVLVLHLCASFKKYCGLSFVLSGSAVSFGRMTLQICSL